MRFKENLKKIGIDLSNSINRLVSNAKKYFKNKEDGLKERIKNSISVLSEETKNELSRIHHKVNSLEYNVYQGGVNGHIKLIPENPVNFKSKTLTLSPDPDEDPEILENPKEYGFYLSPTERFPQKDRYLIETTGPKVLKTPFYDQGKKKEEEKVKNKYFQYIDTENKIVNINQKQLVATNAGITEIMSGSFPNTSDSNQSNYLAEYFYSTTSNIVAEYKEDGIRKEFKLYIYPLDPKKLDELEGNIKIDNTHTSYITLNEKIKKDGYLLISFNLKKGYEYTKISADIKITYKDQSSIYLFENGVTIFPLEITKENNDNLIEDSTDAYGDPDGISYKYNELIPQRGAYIDVYLKIDDKTIQSSVYGTLIYKNNNNNNEIEKVLVDDKNNIYKITFEIPANTESTFYNNVSHNRQRSLLGIIYVGGSDGSSIMPPVIIKFRQDCLKTSSYKTFTNYNTDLFYSEWAYDYTYISNNEKSVLKSQFYKKDGSIIDGSEDLGYENSSKIKAYARNIDNISTVEIKSFLGTGLSNNSNGPLTKLKVQSYKINTIYSVLYSEYDNGVYDISGILAIQDNESFFNPKVGIVDSETYSKIQGLKNDEESSIIDKAEELISTSYEIDRSDYIDSNPETEIVTTLYLCVFVPNIKTSFKYSEIFRKHNITADDFVKTGTTGEYSIGYYEKELENNFTVRLHTNPDEEYLVSDEDTTLRIEKLEVIVKAPEKIDNTEYYNDSSSSFIATLNSIGDSNSFPDVTILKFTTKTGKERSITKSIESEEFTLGNTFKNYDKSYDDGFLNNHYEIIDLKKKYVIEITPQLNEYLLYSGMASEMFNPYVSSNGFNEYVYNIECFLLNIDKENDKEIDKKIISFNLTNEINSNAVLNYSINNYRYYDKRKTRHGIKRIYIYWKSNENIPSDMEDLISFKVNHGNYYNYCINKNVSMENLTSNTFKLKFIINFKNIKFGISSIDIKIKEKV